METVAIGVPAVMVMFITHELQYFFFSQHGLLPPPPMAAIAVMTAASAMMDCVMIVMFIYTYAKVEMLILFNFL